MTWSYTVRSVLLIYGIAVQHSISEYRVIKPLAKIRNFNTGFKRNVGESDTMMLGDLECIVVPFLKILRIAENSYS